MNFLAFERAHDNCISSCVNEVQRRKNQFFELLQLAVCDNVVTDMLCI